MNYDKKIMYIKNILISKYSLKKSKIKIKGYQSIRNYELILLYKEDKKIVKNGENLKQLMQKCNYVLISLIETLIIEFGFALHIFSLHPIYMHIFTKNKFSEWQKYFFRKFSINF